MFLVVRLGQLHGKLHIKNRRLRHQQMDSADVLLLNILVLLYGVKSVKTKLISQIESTMQLSKNFWLSEFTKFAPR